MSRPKLGERRMDVYCCAEEACPAHVLVSVNTVLWSVRVARTPAEVQGVTVRALTSDGRGWIRLLGRAKVQQR